jgi:RNase P subunit RPR2
MKTENAFCSGCGHQVRLAFTDPPPHDGQAPLRDGAEIICLDYKEGCSAGKCPATGKPGIVMGVRLAKSHMNDEVFDTIHARCEGCGEVSDLEVLDDTFALCTMCNTTNRYVMLKLADESEIALTGR